MERPVRLRPQGPWLQGAHGGDGIEFFNVEIRITFLTDMICCCKRLASCIQ